MLDKKKFRIVRVETYEAIKEAYSEETIQELLEMKAPIAWQKVKENYQVDEIKDKPKPT